MSNTLAKLFKSIEKSNKKFNAMTKAEKRVMIAQDAIARLELKNLIAEQGTLIELNAKPGFDRFDADASVQTIINSETAKCEVCAKGALFCSFVGRVNDFKYGVLNGYDRGETFHAKLYEIFSKKQLCLIETAFEGSQIMDYVDVSEKEIAKAERFYNTHYIKNLEGTQKSLLIKICENIINNKGTFKP